MNSSVKLNTPCELINITPLNPFISQCQIKVCYVGDDPNRNRSVITKDVAKNIANTLPGSPIVGFYNNETKDFEEHNRSIKISNGKLKFEDTTRPYGFIDMSAKVWFQDYLDGDVVHTYMVTEGYLWTGQYPEAKRILEKGNNQSMELDPETLKGFWTQDVNSGIDFFIINDAIFSKLCILGDDFEPCFEGANITKFSLDDDFNNKIYALMKEVRELKGGNLTVEDNKKPEEGALDPVVDPVQEVPAGETPEGAAALEGQEGAEPEITEPEATVEPEQPEVAEDPVEPETVEEPTEGENPENEGEGVQFSLSDFQKLKEDYTNLEAQYNELQTKYSAMKESYDSLVEFKKVKDREDKQAIIDSFYMLSDEDKKEVQDNMDNYSLHEIEAELAIICVRNKLDLSGNANNNNNDLGTTFSLEGVDDDSEDTNIPALVSVLRKNRENKN